MKITNSNKLFGLYAITDTSVTDPQKNISSVKQALRGGAHLIQYRDKSHNQKQRLEVCLAMRELTKKFDAVFIINDDVELALTTNADGVHLGQKDTRLKHARKLLGPDAIIGISCYNNFDLAMLAAADGADYIAFGRFFPSHTKPDAAPADVSLLRRAKKELSLPIAAIGGINANNGKTLVDAGADMLAVVNDVFGNSDIEAAAEKYRSFFK